MDITRERFPFEVTKIIREIADSHFVAFDLELSGVAGRKLRLEPGKPSLQEYYEELKEAAEKYQILQFGLTIVHEDVAKGQYTVKPYNFNISQVPTLHERHFKRTWSMNSGAVAFLLRNGFDFGKQMATGIQFLSRSEEQQVRARMDEIDNIKRPDMVLKPEDDALIDHIRISVKHWMGTPPENREAFLNIPAEERAKRVPGTLNRYQIRLTHQIVQNEFPGLKTQGMNHFVQITNPSEDSLNETKRMEEEMVKREVSRAVGFRWILEALSGNDIEDLPPEYVLPALPKTTNTNSTSQEIRVGGFVNDLNQRLKVRGKILVGHNCFTDLVNLHKFMVGSLPETVEEFTASVSKIFPAIIDTKHIASFGNARWGDTSLAKVEEDLKAEAEPKIVLAADFDRYRYTNIEHEAGFDSFLTANVAIRASVKMQREGLYLQAEHAQAGEMKHKPTAFGSRAGVGSASGLSDTGSINIQPQLGLIDRSINVDPIMEKTSAPITTNPAAELVAVKEARPSTAGTRVSKESAKVISAFARATIYDVLDEQQGNENMPGDDQPSGKEQKANTAKLPEKALSISNQQTPTIQVGEIMPPWNSDFWSVFGNRLQVNGCKEGICQL